MSDGEIWTVAWGVAFAFDVFASPAQPLNTAAPHASIAKIAVAPQPRGSPTPNSFAPFAFVACTLAIRPLRTISFREEDYGFNARKKYWLDVHIRDRHAPVRAYIAYFQYLFSRFFRSNRRGFLAGWPVRMDG
jgi:hypothetical protein